MSKITPPSPKISLTLKTDAQAKELTVPQPSIEEEKSSIAFRKALHKETARDEKPTTSKPQGHKKEAKELKNLKGREKSKQMPSAPIKNAPLNTKKSIPMPVKTTKEKPAQPNVKKDAPHASLKKNAPQSSLSENKIKQKKKLPTEKEIFSLSPAAASVQNLAAGTQATNPVSSTSTAPAEVSQLKTERVAQVIEKASARILLSQGQEVSDTQVRIELHDSLLPETTLTAQKSPDGGLQLTFATDSPEASALLGKLQQGLGKHLSQTQNMPFHIQAVNSQGQVLSQTDALPERGGGGAGQNFSGQSQHKPDWESVEDRMKDKK